MTDTKVSREDIRIEVEKAIKQVLKTRTEHENAVAYLTRMQITLEVMDK